MRNISNERQSFDVMYIKPNYQNIDNEIVDKGYEVVKIVASKPDEDVMFLLGNNLEILNKLDIKLFNSSFFEQTIDLLSDSEFEYVYYKFLLKWLENISEFIEIDIDNLDSKFNSTESKRIILKQLIYFIMNFLPYNILAPILTEIAKRNDIQSSEQFGNVIDKYHIDLNNGLFDELNEIKDNILSEFDSNIMKLKNLKESIKNLISVSKKNSLEQEELLDESINKQLSQIEMYKNIINECSLDNILTFLKLYAEKDFDNLITL